MPPWLQLTASTTCTSATPVARCGEPPVGTRSASTSASSPPADATEVLAATNRVLDRALANGGLQRWSAEAGVIGVEPASTQVDAAFGLAAAV